MISMQCNTENAGAGSRGLQGGTVCGRFATGFISWYMNRWDWLRNCDEFSGAKSPLGRMWQLRCVILLIIAVGLPPTSVLAAQKPCEAFIGMQFPDGEITLSKTIPAGNFETPNGDTYPVPAFCRVIGVSRPTEQSTIHFEVWLPEDWNGRYYQHGQGGGGGQINYQALVGFLLEGNAVAASDDGHRVKGIDDLYRWAYQQPEKVIDWGYRASKRTRDSAHTLMEAYYGAGPHHSYFAGCSNGGQQGLMAAQRYPQDWDGVLVGAPNISLTRDLASLGFRGQLWLDGPLSRIPAQMLPVIQEAALASCLPQAHVVDGIAADPRYCPFDPAVLACTEKRTDDCLSVPQLTTLNKIYQGAPHPGTGELFQFGFLPTMETGSGWKHFMPVSEPMSDDVATPPTPPVSLSIAEAFYRYVVFDDPQWRLAALNFDRDMVVAYNKKVGGEPLSSVLNADNPDLSAFKNRGGKLLMYFGWGDAAIPAQGGIRYFDDVVERMGGLADTQDFFRLFMAPGMGHCAGGPGANAFGQMVNPALPLPLQNDPRHHIRRALEAWVEEGRAPDKIIATKYVNDKPEAGVAFTRPLCPYPQRAILQGKEENKENEKTESAQRAEHFACEDPPRERLPIHHPETTGVP